MMPFLLVVLTLECLTSAVLLFQMTDQVVMHSMVGGVYLLACIGLLVSAFARVDAPLLIAVVGTLALLTLFVSISENVIGYIDISSLLILCTCAFIAATHVEL